MFALRLQASLLHDLVACSNLNVQLTRTRREYFGLKSIQNYQFSRCA